jgi:Cys-tRNA(Pro) deacylase
MPLMHANARAVAEAAEARSLSIDVVEFPDGTRTAVDAANAIGVEVGQIVKSLVFRVGDEIVVALVSGSNQLDERRLAALTASSGKAARVDADAVREATGYPIGGVPPFGHRQALRVFVDRDLLGYAEVWAAAGTPRHVFAITPDDLVRASAGEVADLAR